MVLINSAFSVIAILKVCKMNQLFGIWHISNKILEFMINSLSNQTLQPFFFFLILIFLNYCDPGWVRPFRGLGS